MRRRTAGENDDNNMNCCCLLVAPVHWVWPLEFMRPLYVWPPKGKKKNERKKRKTKPICQKRKEQNMARRERNGKRQWKWPRMSNRCQGSHGVRRLLTSSIRLCLRNLAQPTQSYLSLSAFLQWIRRTYLGTHLTLTLWNAQCYRECWMMPHCRDATIYPVFSIPMIIIKSGNHGAQHVIENFFWQKVLVQSK